MTKVFSVPTSFEVTVSVTNDGEPHNVEVEVDNGIVCILAALSPNAARRLARALTESADTCDSGED